MFAITIVVVAMPDGPGRCIHFEERVDDLHRVAYARVAGSEHSETHQGQRIGTHQMTGAACVLRSRHVFHVHMLLETRSGSLSCSRSDPNIISLDAKFPAPVRTRNEHPAVDGGVPDIGNLAEIF